MVTLPGQLFSAYDCGGKGFVKKITPFYQTGCIIVLEYCCDMLSFTHIQVCLILCGFVYVLDSLVFILCPKRSGSLSFNYVVLLYQLTGDTFDYLYRMTA